MIVAMNFAYHFLKSSLIKRCRPFWRRDAASDKSASGRGSGPTTGLSVSGALGVAKLALMLSPFWVLAGLADAKPSQAAERISFSYGAVERSISVDSLQIYVEEGRVTDELAPYVSYIENFDPNALVQARALLSQRADVDVTTMAQFAYTPQGEYVLAQVGEVFRTGARLPGGQGLRGAAIGAAADSEKGLTILNVIQRFPTPVLRVDLRKGLSIASQVSDAFSQAQRATDLVVQLSFDSATEPFPDGASAASLNDLVSGNGPYGYRQLSLRLKASNRPVDVYLPQAVPFSSSLESPELALAEGQALPAVVISHGFGNDRGTYAYLAQFLASHGFAVINVEHPGSSADQLDALVSGRTGQAVPDEEFISRPLLISNVLDDLQALARTEKNILKNVDFDNVGMIGQSFGGYTALTVAGAPVDLDLLRESCPPEFSVNVSILLQCQAVALLPEEGSNYVLEGQSSIDFSDPRVQAVVAINPIASTILGPESMAQIEVPVLMMTGSADTVAPSLPEQIQPFVWLNARFNDEWQAREAEAEGDEVGHSLLDDPLPPLVSPHYLLTLEGGTHFSTLGISGRETFDLPPEIVGPVPEVAQRYTEAMSLAFLSTYLKGDARYQPVLTSAFTTRFSRPEMPLSIISTLSAEQLVEQLRAALESESSVVERSLQRVLETALEDVEALHDQRLH